MHGKYRHVYGQVSIHMFVNVSVDMWTCSQECVPACVQRRGTNVRYKRVCRQAKTKMCTDRSVDSLECRQAHENAHKQLCRFFKNARQPEHKKRHCYDEDI